MALPAMPGGRLRLRGPYLQAAIRLGSRVLRCGRHLLERPISPRRRRLLRRRRPALRRDYPGLHRAGHAPDRRRESRERRRASADLGRSLASVLTNETPAVPQHPEPRGVLLQCGGDPRSWEIPVPPLATRRFALLAALTLVSFSLVHAGDQPKPTPGGAAGTDRSPVDLMITRDQRRLIVVNQTSGTLALVDAASGQALQELPCGERPSALAISLDEKRIVVSSTYSGDLILFGFDGERLTE